MQNLRYFLTVIAGAFSAVALAVIFPSLVPVAPVTEVLGAPESQATFQKNLIPMTDSTYTLGTTTKTWLNLYTDEVCLAGDCKTAWPVGGSGSFASSSPWTNGYLAYVVDNNTFSSVATGTLTTTATGLQLSATRGLVGGASILSLTAGYEIPTTTRMNVWDSKGNGTVTSVAMTVPTGLAISGSPITTTGTLALTLDTGYQIPTTTRMITWDTAYGWGNHAVAGYLTTVDISANTNLTAGDALTLTGDDIDFDGGATPSGDLGGTWASPSVTDDSHNHTGTTLSGIDISADTNLSADGTEIVLTGDALSLGTALTFTTGTSTTSFFSALGTFTNSVISTLLTALNVTVTGLLDVGGGSLEVPNGTAPTVDAIGEIAVDSTYGQFKYFDGNTTHAITGTSSKSFRVASSTIGDNGNTFWNGTSTINIHSDFEAITLVSFECTATTTGTAYIRFGDGTNWTNTGTCSTSGVTTYASSNNTFTASEDFSVQIWGGSSTTRALRITTDTYKTPQ